MTIYDMGEIVSDIRDVPQNWIYKYYYSKLTKGTKIQQSFDGRIIKVKSVVSRDTIPSLCFFYKGGTYYWRDFSQGQGGDAARFVSFHYNKVYGAAVSMIMKDYEDCLNNGHVSEDDDLLEERIVKPEFEVDTKIYHYGDLKLWENHKVNLDLLTKFKIRNVDEYRIKKGGETLRFGGQVYGFFNEKGCYQLYQPFVPKAKYIYIDTSYLIGSEQLKFESESCGITSGLKDLASISALELRCEYVAPPSENTLLPKDKIDWLKSKYKFIFTMFDNDEAGLRAMRLYKKIYDIPFVHVNMKKDLADNNSYYSVEGLKYAYTKLIDEKRNPKQ